MVEVRSYLKHVDYYGFLCSIAVLPLSIKWSSKLLFISILLGFIRSIYKRDFSWFSKQKPLTFIYILFFAYILIQGLLIDGPRILFKTFERSYAPYFIFLLLPMFYKKRGIVKLIPKAFLLGIGSLFVIMLFYSIIECQWYNRTKVLEVFDIHHLYISLYILFCLNFILSQRGYLGFVKMSVILVPLLGFLVFFQSKSAILVALLLVLYHLVLSYNLNSLKKIGIVFFIFLALIVFNTYFYQIYLDALDFRSRIWDVALQSVSQKPIFGYGGANEQFVINREHFIEGNYDFLDSNLNAHNQFISFLIKYGLIGFIMALFPFIYLMFSKKSKIKFEYFGLLIILFFMSFIESIYNRHHGIVFCCIVLYYYHTLLIKDKNRA